MSKNFYFTFGDDRLDKYVKLLPRMKKLQEIECSWSVEGSGVLLTVRRIFFLSFKKGI